MSEVHSSRLSSNAGAQQRLTITYRPIAELKPNPGNPRRHSERQLRQLAASIREFGFLGPVLIDGQGQLIAGHGRTEAARRLGFQQLPTISAQHLTEKQILAYLLADNKLAQNSTWDERLLGEQLKILLEADISFNTDVIGFEPAEIDLLIEGIAPPVEAGQDVADVLPESSSVSVTKTGDVWCLGPHRVVCGDSLDARAYSVLLEGALANMVLTDAPFNVHIDGHASGLGTFHHADFKMASGEMSESEFTSFLTSAATLAALHCVNGSLHYWFMDWRHMSEIIAAGKRVYGELKNLCIWAKDNAGMGSFYRSQHELVFLFKKGKGSHRNNIELGKYGRYRSNLWRYPGANSFSRRTEEGNLLALHPTVKPVALIADAIMDCTVRGEIVLDPFLGSGTTVIAAERTGRVCCGIEIDPRYVDTIVRRWQRFTGKTATHGASGRIFDELEQEASHGLQR